MAGGFRGGMPALLGRAGPAPLSVIPTASSSIISPATGVSTFSLFTTPLGGTIFQSPPIEWDTVNKRKVTATKKTWTTAQAEEWPVVSGANGVIGLRVALRWPIISGTDFKTLRKYFESPDQVTWDPGARARVIGEKYFVTFVSLKQQKNHRFQDYVIDAEATLEIRGIA